MNFSSIYFYRHQAWSFLLLVCVPQIPFKYFWNKKEATKEKSISDTWPCCDLDSVWINSKNLIRLSAGYDDNQY